MPSPAPQQSDPADAQVLAQRSDCSPETPSLGLPGCPSGLSTPRAPGRLESSFSIEAILARPDPSAHAISPPPVTRCMAWSPWSALPGCAAPALRWTCPAPASWLPTCLNVGVYPLYPQFSVPQLHMAHFCGIQGFGNPGLELAHSPGLWSPLDLVPIKDPQETERHPKRARTMFNLEQLQELERVFSKHHNLVGKKRAQLAAKLHLTENQVRIWFQNRRVKYQKQQKLKLPATSAIAASLDEPTSSSDSSIQREDAESGSDS
ncbi:PREDICTED: homeobox protein notochord [Dipodomys ordii]|uniref:Homeobox protein notochord n=1 Tax=Dipodomys ordii TaxID=10020 RepID=A0A1S3GSG9_DIPOR|nr:PREDICTED: homeobox protein notochord [Dipodomys ordii]